MGQELEAISEETFNEKMASAFEGWANNLASQLNDVLWKADTTFQDIAESFAKMVTQMMIQYMIIEPLIGWMTGAFGFEKGSVLSQGKIKPFIRGGIVSKPTIFPMADGIGLMGEAGPEAIMPLKRGRDGRLGVESEGGGETINVTMNINALDSRSVIEMLEKNRGVVESMVVSSFRRNGMMRTAIKQGI